MSKHTTNETEHLAEDAQALIAATAHVAEAKVVEARKRLTAAMSQVQEKAIAGAKATDQAIREHPYQAIGVALGIGALIGYLIGRRN